VVAVGGAMVGLSDGKRSSGWLLRLAGLALIGAGLRPVVEEEIRRAGLERRSVAFRSSINIDRPVHDVFAFFKDFENLPRVIGALRSVVDHQDGRSHWEIYAPSSEDPLEWDAVVTKYVPNSVLAWESVPGSVVENSGLLRFTPLSDTRTHLDVSIVYRPTSTDLADAVQSFFAPRAAAQLHADLEHARFYLESLPNVSGAEVEEEEGADAESEAKPEDDRAGLPR
jgi:uncharacterized membrane protein